MSIKNVRIRRELATYGMTQGDLAKVLNLSQPFVSMLLKYELAKNEQDEIIRKIREYSAMPA